MSGNKKNTGGTLTAIPDYNSATTGQKNTFTVSANQNFYTTVFTNIAIDSIALSGDSMAVLNINAAHNISELERGVLLTTQNCVNEGNNGEFLFVEAFNNSAKWILVSGSNNFVAEADSAGIISNTSPLNNAFAIQILEDDTQLTITQDGDLGNDTHLSTLTYPASMVLYGDFSQVLRVAGSARLYLK